MNQRGYAMLEKIALQKGFISETQCKEAQMACGKAPNREAALKAYFLSQNIISQADMKVVIEAFQSLKVSQKSTAFGKEALKMGFIDEAAFQRALSIQKNVLRSRKMPHFIGALLIKSGDLTREQAQPVLDAQRKKNSPDPAPKASPAPPPGKDDEANTPAPPPKKEETEEFVSQEMGGGMLLETDRLGLVARLLKTDAFEKGISPDDIIKFLSEFGIVYGVVDREQIMGFIKSRGFHQKAFKIAQGRAPVKGRDARVAYFFETDHLKAGGLDDEGNMDFKDRGAIPWVDEGTLLARKLPMEASEDGRTIFGGSMKISPARDANFGCKDGAVLSEDGLEIVSQTSGCPELDTSGAIKVSKVFRVDDDVNYKTGHLDYVGNIEVDGALKSGFMVKGNDITIKEVDGGTIIASGNVVIKGGVNGAEIYSQGSVRAKYIQNSRIFCLGNIRILKEIVDSEIANSGELRIDEGEIISSRVAANLGVKTRHLGTEKSTPTHIVLGQDQYVAGEVDKKKEELAAIAQQLATLVGRKKKLLENLDKARQISPGLVHQMERVSDLRDRKDKKAPGTQQSALLLERLERELTENLNRIANYRDQILSIDGESRDLISQKKDLNRQIHNLEEWQTVNPGNPQMVIHGRISPGAVIEGEGTQLEIKEKRTRVKIIQVALEEEEGAYEIQIHDKA